LNLTAHIQKAILNTNQEHINFSEYGISYAPEYLITTNIAKEIYTLKNKNNEIGVYLEWNIKDLLKDEGIELSEVVRDGKCDICIFFNRTTNAIIEVKNTVTNKGPRLTSIHKDIERIQYFLLNIDSTFKDSYVCFLVQAKNKKKTKEKATSYIDEIRKEFDTLSFKENIKFFKENNNDEEEFFLASVVLLIKPNT